MADATEAYVAETIGLVERLEDCLRAFGEVLDQAVNNKLSAQQKADIRRIAQQMRELGADVERAKAKRN